MAIIDLKFPSVHPDPVFFLTHSVRYIEGNKAQTANEQMTTSCRFAQAMPSPGHGNANGRESGQKERKTMQYLVGLILILASLFSTVAMADDAEGKITSINKDSETLSLDDGKTYKLPGEFDYSAINKGMKVLIIYDMVDNTRFITDIQEAP